MAPVLNFNMAVMEVAGETGVGGVLFLGDASAPSNLAALLRTAFASTPAGLAPLVMADQEGGGVQRLGDAVPSMPWPRTMAQTMTPAQVKALTTRVGASMLQLGVNVDLAPVIDLDAGAGPSTTDPDGLRSFSAVPLTAANYGVAYLQGLVAAGVVPVVKHFPGLGGASANTDYSPATTPPLATLEGAGLVPFRAAIAAGVPAVMVSNATVPGLTTEPASLSPAAINGLLRHTLGFEGLVVTDSLSAVAITDAGYQVPAAAVAAIAAGADMILFGDTATQGQTNLLTPASVTASIDQIVSAIVTTAARGKIPLARVNAAVLRVLTIKHTQLCPASS